MFIVLILLKNIKYEKIIPPPRIFYFFLILTFVSSCSKETVQSDEVKISKQEIVKKGIEEQRQYVVTNFKVIALELAKLSKEDAIKNLIVSKAAEKFDGDYNVLIKNLLAEPLIAQKNSAGIIKETLKAFVDIEDKNYFPQIYIPRLSKLSQNGPTPSNLDKPIEFVLYDGNEQNPEFPGWLLNDKNELVLSGRMISEDYALKNNVWVISLNEIVNNEGEASVVSAGPPPPPPNPNLINLKFETMGINCLYESWAAGKSDVSIRAIRYTWNGRIDGNSGAAFADYTSDRSTNDTRGILIRQWDRDETWNGTSLQMKTIDFNLQFNWDISNWFTKPINYFYVIFEKDNWPTGEKVWWGAPLFAHFSGNSLMRQLTFRSADGPYFFSSFYASKTGFPTGVTAANTEWYTDGTVKEQWNENSCIKYNIIQYQ